MCFNNHIRSTLVDNYRYFSLVDNYSYSICVVDKSILITIGIIKMLIVR